jgi:glycosyltransferase involved in cell wall biosynthesis
VASSSTEAQRRLAARLGDAGVIIETRHQDRIESAYGLADAYLFPVTRALDAIEMPLSVLEAAACDLAIVSTPFGGLPDLFREGILWSRTSDQIVESVRILAAGGAAGVSPGTRRIVQGLTWDRVAAEVLHALRVSRGPA